MKAALIPSDQTVDELIVHFFAFYVNFASDSRIVDTRKGLFHQISPDDRLLNEEDPDNCVLNHGFFILDPYDVNHNPGKVIKRGSELEGKFLREACRFVKENVAESQAERYRELSLSA